MPKTKFRPQADGFKFENVWHFTPDEREALKARLRELVPAATFLLLGIPLVAVLVPAAPVSIPIALMVIIGNAVPERHGRCSGMAFSALDYCLANLVAMRGNTTEPPVGTRIREYMWQRTVDATIANGLRWLQWMFMKSLPNGAGLPWLRDRSLEEWAILKSHIDRGEPWPIGIMGEGGDPFDNHVVLAYGYEDPGDGTAIIYLYDPNCPDHESVTTFDFNRSVLGAPVREDCSNREGHHAGGDVPGFFCQAYSFTAPPVAVGLSQGLFVTPGPEVHLGGLGSGFTCEAKNYGWGDTPPITLYCVGRPASNPNEVRDVTAGGALTAIPQGSTQRMAVVHRFEGSLGPRRFTMQAYLGNITGVEVFKRVPEVEPGTLSVLDVVVREALPPNPTPVQPGRYFVHRSDQANTRGNVTLLNHPLLNGKPNAVLLVTQNFNPGGVGGVYNLHVTGVYYDGTQQWAIFNEDQISMPVGAAFNNEVLDTSDSSDQSVGTQIVRSDNTHNHITVINSEVANGFPNAILNITQNWNPGGRTPGVYNPHATGVYYESNRWTVFNQDMAALPLNAGFNFKISRPGNTVFIHTATAANTQNHVTYIDHPAVNGHPDVLLQVTPNWRGSASIPGNGYNTHPYGVWYDSRGRWSVFNQDFAPMQYQLVFNISIH